MNLGDRVTKGSQPFTIVAQFGLLTVLKEGTDVTMQNAYLWVELDSLMIPTNMTKCTPLALEMVGALVFTGIQFPIKSGPYNEGGTSNYRISYQGRDYTFRVAHSGKLVSVGL